MELKSIKSSAVILGGISICFIFFGQQKRTRTESMITGKRLHFESKKNNRSICISISTKISARRTNKSINFGKKNRNESEKGSKKNGE